MKRRLGTVLAILLCIIVTAVSVYADDGKSQNPDYATDYYMIVQSAGMLLTSQSIFLISLLT